MFTAAYFCASFQNQPFLQRAVVPFFETVFRNEDLGTRPVHCCYWGVIDSRPPELGNKCLYTTLCIHTSYFYFCLYL